MPLSSLDFIQIGFFHHTGFIEGPFLQRDPAAPLTRLVTTNVSSGGVGVSANHHSPQQPRVLGVPDRKTGGVM